MGLPFLAVAAWSMPSLNEDHKQSLRRLREQIVKKQQPNGSSEFFATLRRPPINEAKPPMPRSLAACGWNLMCRSRRSSLSKAIVWSTVQRPLTSIRTKF